MDTQPKDIFDYIIAIKKRLPRVYSVVGFIFFISILVAFLLPQQYKSQSTILIEQQEIPPELVMSTVTSYAAERIQIIQARVMSRTNLLEIIDKFKLYKDERKFETTEQIINRMRQDVSLDLRSADVVDPRTGRPSSATIAFSLSYTGKIPTQVQRVVNELTSLYLNENLQNRTVKAEETSNFFKSETERLGADIGQLESKLATFKRENADALPDVKRINLEALTRSEAELGAIDSNVSVLRERKFYLQNQLAMVKPSSSLDESATLRLKSIESKYIEAKSKYSDEHPDVVSLANEISLLKAKNNLLSDVGGLEDKLASLQLQLKNKQSSYTDDHPDIIKLKNNIATVKDEIAIAKKDAANQDDNGSANIDNPVYIGLRDQISTIEFELLSDMERRSKLIDKIATIENRILKSPEVEREYLSLQRDYDNAVARYRETKAKQMQADVARQLESESKGERFTLIDPAALPEKPISPNRPGIILVGLMMALIAGVGYALMAELVAGTVRGAKSVVNIAGVRPLAILPYCYTDIDILKRKRRYIKYAISFVVLIIISVLFVHFSITPLDVLWFRFARKAEMVTS